MILKKTLSLSGRLVLAATLVAGAVAPSLAADIYLVARPFNMTMPDGVVVPMWGFAEDADGDLATVGTEAPTVPGPTIKLTGADSVLNIHVRNELPDSISIVIPGLPVALSPVKFIDAQGRARARAFTTETAPGGGMGTYTFSNLKDGTYLYHSGSHPAVQVQMGLYGAVASITSPGVAYAGLTFDSELTVLYSEVDSALHADVASGAYGTPPAATSTIDYDPDYFLVNGKPYEVGDSPLLAGGADQDVLIRFLNAGLREHVPMLIGGHMSLIAEDGNPLPYARSQYTAPLPPGKTMDVLWRPTATGTYTMFDRRHSLTTAGASEGGMFSQISVSDTPCGDVDGDGRVGIVDALLVAQYVVGLRSCSTIARFDLCDINPQPNTDGTCNVADALKMAQCTVGLFPCNLTCSPVVCTP